MHQNRLDIIFVFSEHFDKSTTEVLKWLVFFGYKNIIRINEDSKISYKYKLTSQGISDFTIYLENSEYSFSEIKAIWFRRTHLKIAEIESLTKDIEDKEIRRDIYNFLAKELETLEANFRTLLKSHSNRIGNPELESLNKLKVLTMAKEIGLNIPTTFVLTESSDIEKFKSNNLYVTKPFSESLIAKNRKFRIDTFTSTFESITFDRKVKFFPVKIQNNIRKKFEIRSVYFKGIFFSMAIFSQENYQTQTDFRKYDASNPNALSSFNLPNELCVKLKELLTKLDLDFVSIDLIYTFEKEFVFLEINPVGQYDMVSVPCNFHLDKLIAKKLINGID